MQSLFFDGLGPIRASDDLLLYRVLLAALGVSLALADVRAVRVHDLTQLGSHVLQLPAVYTVWQAYSQGSGIAALALPPLVWSWLTPLPGSARAVVLAGPRPIPCARAVAAQSARPMGLTSDLLHRKWARIRPIERSCRRGFSITASHPKSVRVNTSVQDIRSVYLGGTITRSDWRRSLVSGLGLVGVVPAAARPHILWPILPGAVLGRFDYVGPYSVSGDPEDDEWNNDEDNLEDAGSEWVVTGALVGPQRGPRVSRDPSNHAYAGGQTQPCLTQEMAVQEVW